ncbi:rab gdp/gtp exchange factor [Anaeramoeba flamelloides]|uniref:Rab gdp/gtp exchange factor n=1 Tax=Anaeramoeba flamelloides TaxID=1746091 RepID=A0ABQ8ZDP7_9EUKA|nr:rab gdp/gtp exchange factor [Anaeramoeba flamelloides]
MSTGFDSQELTKNKLLLELLNNTENEDLLDFLNRHSGTFFSPVSESIKNREITRDFLETHTTAKNPLNDDLFVAHNSYLGQIRSITTKDLKVEFVTKCQPPIKERDLNKTTLSDLFPNSLPSLNHTSNQEKLVQKRTKFPEVDILGEAVVQDPRNTINEISIIFISSPLCKDNGPNDDKLLFDFNTKQTETRNITKEDQDLKKQKGDNGQDILVSLAPYLGNEELQKLIFRVGKFGRKLLGSNLHPNEIPEILFSYLDSAIEGFPTEKLLLDEEYEEKKIEKLKLFLTEIILLELSKTLFYFDEKVDKTIDETMNVLFTKFKVLDFNNLEISDKLFNKEILNRAIKALRSIDNYVTPRQKMTCIAECSIILGELFDNNFSGADEFIPILIYTLIQANPPRWHSNLQFIENFSDPEWLPLSSLGFHFTNIFSATYFLQNLEPEQIKDPDPLLFIVTKNAFELLHSLTKKIDYTNYGECNDSFEFLENPNEKIYKNNNNYKNSLKSRKVKSRKKWRKTRNLTREKIINDYYKYRQNPLHFDSKDQDGFLMIETNLKKNKSSKKNKIDNKKGMVNQKDNNGKKENERNVEKAETGKKVKANKVEDVNKNKLNLKRKIEKNVTTLEMAEMGEGEEQDELKKKMKNQKKKKKKVTLEKNILNLKNPYNKFQFYNVNFEELKINDVNQLLQDYKKLVRAVVETDSTKLK